MQTTTDRHTIQTIANRVAADVSADLRRGIIDSGGAYDECYYSFRMQTRDAGLDLSDDHLAHYSQQMADLAIERA